MNLNIHAIIRRKAVSMFLRASQSAIAFQASRLELGYYCWQNLLE